MKQQRSALLVLCLIYVATTFSQVGIGTDTPASTLHVEGDPTDAIVLDGIIAPKLTGDQLALKSYAIAQTGTIVYITAAASSPSGAVSEVDREGYFFFDGIQWQLLDYGTDGNTERPWRHTADDTNAEIGDNEIYTNSEHIGIGTQHPERMLHVLGENARMRIDRRSNNCCAALFINEAQTDETLVGGWDVTNQITRFSIGYDVDSGGGSDNNFVILQSNSNVGIGFLNPTFKVHVDGSLRATDFISDTDTYPDYVWEYYNTGHSNLKPEYAITSLRDTEAFIRKHGHLPGIKGMHELSTTKDGAYEMNVSATQIQLLEKIEELFIHTIQQQEKLDHIDSELSILDARIQTISSKESTPPIKK